MFRHSVTYSVTPWLSFVISIYIILVMLVILLTPLLVIIILFYRPTFIYYFRYVRI